MKKKYIEIKTDKNISPSRIFKGDMRKIAKGIFGYNPKTDPRDPLFGKNSQKEKGRE